MRRSGATIERPVTRRGRDRNGRPVTVTLRPAGPGSGIWFTRRPTPGIRDCPGISSPNSGLRNGFRAWLRHRRNERSAGVQARVGNASVRGHATSLGRGRNQVRMVEHLLAACYALGLTDLAVETAGAELPLFDGSALPYVRLLREAGVAGYRNGPAPLRLSRPVLVEDGTGFIAAVPADRLSVNCLVRLPGIGAQFCSTRAVPGALERDICPARTYGPGAGPPRLFERRLRPGFRLRRVAGLLYPERRRFANEPCRHKALDLVGDLALLGRPFAADVFAFQPGHRLNLAFARCIERSIEG